VLHCCPRKQCILSACPPPAKAMYSFTGLFLSFHCRPLCSLSVLYLYCRESNVFFHWALSIVSSSPSLSVLYLYCRESNVFFHWALSIVSLSPSVCAVCTCTAAKAMYSFTGLFVSSHCRPLSALYLDCRESNVFFRWPRFFPPLSLFYLLLVASPCCGAALLGTTAMYSFGRLASSPRAALYYSLSPPHDPPLSLALVYFYEVVCSSNSFFLGCTLFCYPACVSQRSVG
jgi:hypothetical protein